MTDPNAIKAEALREAARLLCAEAQAVGARNDVAHGVRLGYEFAACKLRERARELEESADG